MKCRPIRNNEVLGQLVGALETLAAMVSDLGRDRDRHEQLIAEVERLLAEEASR